MSGMILDAISSPLAMMLYGLATHFLKDLARIRREDGVLISPEAYWAQYPYQTLLAAIGALAGLGALYTTGELTAITAFGAGYMANSMADVIGKRSMERL